MRQFVALSLSGPCCSFGNNLIVFSVQYPHLFSLGTFSKTGPTRKQVSSFRSFMGYSVVYLIE